MLIRDISIKAFMENATPLSEICISFSALNATKRLNSSGRISMVESRACLMSYLNSLIFLGFLMNAGVMAIKAFNIFLYSATVTFSSLLYFWIAWFAMNKL